MNKIPIAISWSGGKDSSMMLYHLMNDETFEIKELHTAISTETERVSLHGIKQELILAQADSIGIPIHFIPIEPDATNAKYEKALNEYYSNLKAQGIHHIGFGDIFLEDLKAYRDQLLSNNGLIGVYPLWKKNSKHLAQKFLNDQFKTLICSSKKSLFPESIRGKIYNQEMIRNFALDVDPCGENGEFHTFAFEGPIFKKPIQFSIDEITTHTYNHELKSGEQVETSFYLSSMELFHRDSLQLFAWHFAVANGYTAPGS